MDKRFGGRATCLCALWALCGCLIAFAGTVAHGAENDVILDDVRITGKSILIFERVGRQVMVVDGQFMLTAGDRTIGGKSAVVWVQEVSSPAGPQHKITVYVEGSARIIEPGGASTTDRNMVVSMTVQGRLSARGKPSNQNPADLPIYQRAMEAKNLAATRTVAPAAQPTTGPASRPTTRPARMPVAERAAITPVYFRADKEELATSKTYKELGPDVMVVFCRGHVYASQGTENTAEFLEFYSESAVVFIQKNVPKKDVRHPLSPNLPTFGDNDSIQGVYLVGAVTISRGDRKMQAPEAYYDFSTDRAIVLNPVFKTMQPERNIPVYVRAKEARMLSAREYYFKDAKVSTSDFYSPSYSIGAQQLTVKDLTPYSSEGEQIGERKAEAKMKNVTFNIDKVPVFWWPAMQGDLTEANIPLRRLSFGSNARFGTGVESTWDFFRLVGLPAPDGVRVDLELDAYSRGPLASLNWKYARVEKSREYSGYGMLTGFIDGDGEDSFGQEAKDIPAPTDRGRALVRHKEFLPDDWELQLELAWLSDVNFLQEFYRDEYWAGKPQETLLYAKKQRDNWAFTALLQYRLNDFQTQTESWPELGFYYIGKPIAGGKATFFNENRVGIKRWLVAEDGDPNFPGAKDSDVMARGDTRNEVNVPLHLGALNLVPYGVARFTGWSDKPEDGDNFRPYGQTGAKANMHVWRVYDGAHNRLLNVNRLKHIITPEAAMWVAGSGGVEPENLFPMDPDVEQRLTSVSGGSFGVYQRLQTKRGTPGNEQTVDWMRLDVVAAFFSDEDSVTLPADGRFQWYRPEYSFARDAINVDYAWCISDATTFLADMNWDVESGKVGRADVGFAVQRDPRLSYYAGIRMIDDLEMTVGTFSFNYKISDRYTVSVMEQYDFRYDGGENLISSISVIRKFARWYGGVTFQVDKTMDNFGAYVTIWPEGIPEVKVSSGRFNPLGMSSMN